MTLSLWTIFDHPLDFPDCFVARRFVASRDGVKVTDDIIVADTLEHLHDRLPPGLACLHRSPEDDPKIVETWL